MCCPTETSSLLIMCIYWVYLFVSIGQRVLMLNTHSIALVRIISRGCYARNNTIHKGVNIITANTILQRANVDTKATYELVIAWLSVGHIYFPEGPGTSGKVHFCRLLFNVVVQ